MTLAFISLDKRNHIYVNDIRSPFVVAAQLPRTHPPLKSVRWVVQLEDEPWGHTDGYDRNRRGAIRLSNQLRQWIERAGLPSHMNRLALKGPASSYFELPFVDANKL